MTTVREAVADDRPRLSAIQTAALDEQWPELLELALDGPPLCLLVETDRPVGYALVIADDETAYVAEFAVAPSEQGQGYGSTLMEALLSRLSERGREQVRLTVRADDERAQSFYADHGFAVLERVPDHYADGGDGLLLSRHL
ncbi:N-acetyltransferase [Haloarculaceae archaeon H-GB2-1]|nr:N-acetyltransferase [Haloarculaceae archaeon H-GB1-1]MEA5385931.1 N-acetyltransferase [Haloarculaceae archaeon H-GB11]MEA5407438.1 N-acetyltransferase [Haloarculaceae archaeon H-GB2-1]